MASNFFGVALHCLGWGNKIGWCEVECRTEGNFSAPPLFPRLLLPLQPLLPLLFLLPTPSTSTFFTATPYTSPYNLYQLLLQLHLLHLLLILLSLLHMYMYRVPKFNKEYNIQGISRGETTQCWKEKEEGAKNYSHRAIGTKFSNDVR